MNSDCNFEWIFFSDFFLGGRLLNLYLYLNFSFFLNLKKYVFLSERLSVSDEEKKRPSEKSLCETEENNSE